MKADLRERLRRLGVSVGAAGVKPPLRPHAPPPPAESVADGSDDTVVLQAEDTLFGPAWLSRTVYPIAHSHGNRPLGDALGLSPDALAGLGVPGSPLRDALFLDTETTGLAGGTGTLAFLVGVGYFAGETETSERGHFIVDQYFLRDPAAELAMMTAIDRRVCARDLLVTFNGRAFDIPLLETRFALARLAAPFAERPHLDLLLPARRLWRNAYTSCSLGSLEYHVLGVHRDQQDIAGFLIPELYRGFLVTGDMHEMSRVMYHNLLDILSMVTLAARLSEALLRPATRGERLAVGRQHARSHAWGEAERVYRAGDDDAAVRLALGEALKKQGRHAEAAEVWEALADGDGAQAIEALIELAKYYEWQAVDLTRALLAARRAQRLTRVSETRAALSHRIERLQRKQTAKARQEKNAAS